jgi:sec-independent protein translocase protein TatC
MISAVFFMGGAAFGYFVVFPPAFGFLMGYTTEYLSPMPTVSEYFTFSLRLLFAFGIVFELPVFMVLLARIGMIDAVLLTKFRSYAMLLSFVLAAILTPPDVVSQLFMAGPLIVLYEISIVAVKFLGGAKK